MLKKIIKTPVTVCSYSEQIMNEIFLLQGNSYSHNILFV